MRTPRWVFVRHLLVLVAMTGAVVAMLGPSHGDHIASMPHRMVQPKRRATGFIAKSDAPTHTKTTPNAAYARTLHPTQINSALADVARTPEAYGFSPAQRDQPVLRHTIPWRDDGSVLVKVERTHLGYPVLDQSASWIIDHEGNVHVRNSDFAPLVVPSLQRPNAHRWLTPIQAQHAAMRALFPKTTTTTSQTTSTTPPPATPLPDLGLPWRLAIMALNNTPIDNVAQQQTQHHAEQQGTLVYVVHVPLASAVPYAAPNVVLDAITGAIMDIRQPVHTLRRSATVYQPHPDANHPTDPVAVVLPRLVENPPTVLDGAYAISRSCVTDSDRVRVITCLDVAAGLACALYPQTRQYLVPFCGEAHLAINQGDQDGFVYAPFDDAGNYGDTAIYTDPFAEVHAYYHVDRITAWFAQLGHPITPHTPLQIVSNVSIPSPELVRCASQRWAALSDLPSAEDARGCLNACRPSIAHPFVAFDNAFYLGDQLQSLLGIHAGLYIGQGAHADFAYDGDILYHEFGHAVADQLSALGNQPYNLDGIGIDHSPGALGEAFSDYFAAALTEDPIIGDYVGGRAQPPRQGLRTLQHGLTCPDYIIGEVHDDSQGFAGALWAIRHAYPHTMTVVPTPRDPSMAHVRVFDRVVYRALATLTRQATTAHAIDAILQEVAEEPALHDPHANVAQCIFNARALMGCERIRSLCTQPSIAELAIVGKGEGSNSLSAFLGANTFTPFAPGPVQLRLMLPPSQPTTVDLPRAITLEATVAKPFVSLENAPDFLGAGSGNQPIDLHVLSRVNAPITMTYSGSGMVQVANTGSDHDITLRVIHDGERTLLRADLPIPSPFTTAATTSPPTAATTVAQPRAVYFAFANHGTQPVHLVNIHTVTPGFACSTVVDPISMDCGSTQVDANLTIPAVAQVEESDHASSTESSASTSHNGGCAGNDHGNGGCQAFGSGDSVLWTVALMLLIRTRRYIKMPL